MNNAPIYIFAAILLGTLIYLWGTGMLFKWQMVVILFLLFMIMIGSIFIITLTNQYAIYFGTATTVLIVLAIAMVYWLQTPLQVQWPFYLSVALLVIAFAIRIILLRQTR